MSSDTFTCARMAAEKSFSVMFAHVRQARGLIILIDVSQPPSGYFPSYRYVDLSQRCSSFTTCVNEFQHKIGLTSGDCDSLQLKDCFQ